MSAFDTSVFGIVRNRDQAHSAVDLLVRLGVSPLAISAVLADRQASRDFAAEQNTVGPDGGTTEGLIVGGLAGGALGLLAGLGTMTLPGLDSLGAYIALGPIVTILGGFGSGGILGGIVGAFAGMGIVESDAVQYHRRLEQGAVLLAVECETADQVTRVTRLFRDLGAENINALDKRSRPEFDEKIHYDLHRL